MSWTQIQLVLCALACSCAVSSSIDAPNYLIGRGMFDMTGPAGEINMMGYANPAQTSRGIHLRQYARAFVVVDLASTKRLAFVSIDACMGSQLITLQVLRRLKEMYGDLYTEQNVCISGTHTHSAPGGFFQYTLFDITSIGYVQETTDVYVNSIVQAIKIAHGNLQPGFILINSGQLLNASRNRSPTAYLFNPPEERAQYEYDTDKEMVLLKFINAKGEGLGMVNWFAVHCTSMNNTNKYISSDNKGLASLTFEEMINGPSAYSGQGPFVAAFAQSNEGDVSPNTKGAHCINNGLPCEANHSTCNGKNEMCIAFGPGKDMYESTEIIAQRQFEKAKELYNSASVHLEGPIDFRHSYVDMTKQQVIVDGKMYNTCKPAMGYSFAAGTTDGPGAFDFTQGTTTGNPFWNAISHLLKDPSAEQVACQHPKPILLDTGEISEPFPWSPSTVDTQLLRIGQLVIAAVPGEFTTMSGRRLRKAIKATLVAHGWSNNTQVVIAGLSNTYSDYIATFEEYKDQRYEAASTIFGPHTLSAYIQNFQRLATDMASGKYPSETDPAPPLNLNTVGKFHYPFPVLFDAAPEGKSIGDVKTDVSSSYSRGELVTVEFWGGNPRNNLMTNSTFLLVERQEGSAWTSVLTDSSWFTKFHWEHNHDSKLSSESIVTIYWQTMPDTTPGVYRIQHFGYKKKLFETPTPYSGISSAFRVA